MAAPDAAASTATPTSPTASGTNSTNADGPVLNIINKRIRNLLKKQKRITQMEESVAQGKTLNKEQQEVLRSKASVIHSIDELEKLRAPLAAAVAEEVALAIKNHQSEQMQPEETSTDATSEDLNVKDGIEDLLELMYFGSLFDLNQQSRYVKEQNGLNMWLTAKEHERVCCLIHNTVTDDDADEEILKERDLDLIADLQHMMIRRPAVSNLSHKDTLHQSIERAKCWIKKSNSPIDPEINVTYAELKEKLRKITASQFFTLPPANMGLDDMAAGVKNVGSVDATHQVPLNGSVMQAGQVDESVGQHQETEENVPDHSNYEEAVNDNQNYSAGEHRKEQDLENQGEMMSAETDEINPQSAVEQTRREFDAKDQPYVHRRNYQNQNYRGGRGGRRGYSNGRGGRGGGGRGGPYQNGGRNQYYDQGSNYVPRSNSYPSRGRGGRGGGGVGVGQSYNYVSAQTNIESA